LNGRMRLWIILNLDQKGSDQAARVDAAPFAHDNPVSPIEASKLVVSVPRLRKS